MENNNSAPVGVDASSHMARWIEAFDDAMCRGLGFDLEDRQQIIATMLRTKVESAALATRQPVAVAIVTDCVTVEKRDGTGYEWGRGTFSCKEKIPDGTQLYAASQPVAAVVKPKVELELPDGDNRIAKVWWSEMRDGVLHLCISVDPAPASDSATVGEDGFLPLPEPAHRGPDGTGSYFDSFTANQLRAAILADRQHQAAIRAAGEVGGEWAEYLRDGETPLDRLKREIKDNDSLASLLAAEKRKNEPAAASGKESQ